MSHQNYLVRKVGTHHTQCVHRIRLKPIGQLPQDLSDIEVVDKAKFVQDPDFSEQYLEPTLFDKFREQVLWKQEPTEIDPEYQEDLHYERQRSSQQTRPTRTPGDEQGGAYLGGGDQGGDVLDGGQQGGADSSSTEEDEITPSQRNTRGSQGVTTSMPQRFHNSYLYEVRDGEKPKPNTVLKFRRGKIPKPEVDPTDSAQTLDVVAGFITLESARKAMKPSARKQNRSAGEPELGDVCRMYNKTTQYNTTELIVASNRKPMKNEDLELALYNLHVQILGIGAKRVHIPMDQRVLRGMQCLDILAALDAQFIGSGIEVHVWNVHVCDKSGGKIPDQENA